MASIAPPALGAVRARTDLDPATLMLGFALATGTAYRLLIGWTAPLWFDETFTAAIAVQPTFGGLIHWCLNEIGGPVYYTLIWAWEKIAGDSNAALRVPSVVCSLAAPALILWRGHPDPRTRALWAGLLSVWTTGLFFASEARSYALLLLLCTGQAIAFLALIRAPRLSTATAWAVLSAVAILTHYHALVIGGVQGLIYLAVHRKRGLATWPAALAFAPVPVWLAYHLPVLTRFGANGWYNILGAWAWKTVPGVLFGPGLPATLLLALMLASWVRHAWRRLAGKPLPYRQADMLLAASGAAAFLIVFGLGFVRPSFSPRYLLPFMPAILFAVAMWARAAERHLAHAGTILLAGATGMALNQFAILLAKPGEDHRYEANMEQPAAWLQAEGARRLVFLWDNPTAEISHDEQMTQVGGFFFARAGRPIPVTMMHLPADADPNRAFTSMPSRPGDALIWLFDPALPRTRGAAYPPRIHALDPRWTCRHYGLFVTCIRRAQPRSA